VRTEFEKIDDEQCLKFTGAVELAGRRWSASIMLAIARGAGRFTQIVASVPGLSDRMLAQRLRELEIESLIVREVVPSTPVQVLYRLSDRGRDLLHSLQPLVGYAQRWADEGDDAARDQPRVVAVKSG
jgi:DNA-binding HxlR family transcriptional regulator